LVPSPTFTSKAHERCYAITGAGNQCSNNGKHEHLGKVFCEQHSKLVFCCAKTNAGHQCTKHSTSEALDGKLYCTQHAKKYC
jgi:hypothetical protein